jgi:diguanylate cyclase (GGDEF)-like protein/PAS domain S-box-containing protein
MEQLHYSQSPDDSRQATVLAVGPDGDPSDLSSLLENVDEAPRPLPRSALGTSLQNQLVQVRLGLASSLFFALRAKHPPTATHSLRVALGCSSWLPFLDVNNPMRDQIEVAALLHDIGKIGVPDGLLLKSARLTRDEMLVMDRHRQMGRDILSGCCGSPGILEIIYYAAARYDGRETEFDRAGDELPLGSRMIAVLDAYDMMTTDHYGRRALGREEAMAELFQAAGKRFDPMLVKQFCQLLSGDQVQLRVGAAPRWLRELAPEASNQLWQRAAPVAEGTGVALDRLFYQKLLEGLHDAVVIVDARLRILVWSPAAERMTGIASASVRDKQWAPCLVEMRDERGGLVQPERCPLAQALQSGIQAKRRLSVAGRNGKELSVDARVVPVFGRDGTAHGATLVLHDASSQVTLEERVQTLHQKATRDPLTQVANRAEFDRVLKRFIDTHLEQGLPCALIICDLDRFKRINDVYGHQAGDEALVNFARLLRRTCRPADLVARYGGEEFVMLCADCDNATATERAEEIRRELSDIPQASLDGKCLTASFGVTEIQGGDTPETMLRRADRALLQAKDTGRNRVVQLGSGISKSEDVENRVGWFAWWHSAPPDELVEKQLVTAVPLKVAIEKLRGFVADQHAEIISVEDETIVLQVDGVHQPLLRRSSDRPVPYQIKLQFSEMRSALEGHPDSQSLRTLVRVSVRPKRNRDRRRADALERARQLLSSLKSYLMAQDLVGRR